MKSKTFQDVEVWRKAHAWVLQIYAFSRKFPYDERFGLTSQLRRAAVSVPANFSEGFKKLGLADKVRYYNIALGYGDTSNLLHLLDEIGCMLEGYVRAVRRAY